MAFTTVSFLFAFLPVCLAVYFLAPRVLRNAVLAVASLVFYAWGGGWLVLILFVSITIDFALGFLAGWAHRKDDDRWRRRAIGVSVASNLALLCWFKYAGFAATQLDAASSRLGLGEVGIPSIVLPVGISFFTFQSMSYTIDVARGRRSHLSNPIDFALYVSLFPQLVAGPIVRFHEIAAEITSRRETWDRFGAGALRFSHGLAKKVLIADTIAPIADAAFAANPGDLSAPTAWIGIAAYTAQIYFDFSGYSDMAIGLGQMFGFTFPENFNRPYSAHSVTDFWRRWHITLSNWFRDYVYIPLGGNRVGGGRMLANLMIVFLVTGLWHGANWTFVVWGIYHGAWLLFERLTDTRDVASGLVALALRRASTLLIVMVGWVFFRAPDVSHAANYLRAMASFGGERPIAVDEAMLTRPVLTLAMASLVVLLPQRVTFGTWLTDARTAAASVGRVTLLGGALPVALMLVAAGTISPFLYFQF